MREMDCSTYLKDVFSSKLPVPILNCSAVLTLTTNLLFVQKKQIMECRYTFSASAKKAFYRFGKLSIVGTDCPPSSKMWLAIR
jgi:hypothetical protein